MFGCVSLIYLTIQNAGFHQQATRFGMVKPSKTVVQLYMFILKKYMDLVNANAGLINPLQKVRVDLVEPPLIISIF